MTAAEIRSARKRLGMSLREFATALKFTGKSRNITAYRWELPESSPSFRRPSAQTITLIKQLLRAP
jgi:DNA-binding transcriptional regulator YiaG